MCAFTQQKSKGIVNVKHIMLKYRLNNYLKVCFLFWNCMYQSISFRMLFLLNYSHAKLVPVEHYTILWFKSISTRRVQLIEQSDDRFFNGIIQIVQATNICIGTCMSWFVRFEFKQTKSKVMWITLFQVSRWR